MLFLCLIPLTSVLGEKKSTKASRRTGVKNRSKVENKFFCAQKTTALLKIIRLNRRGSNSYLQVGLFSLSTLQ